MNNNITIGMDLGDQNHVVVAMDANGKEIEMKTIHNTELSLRKFFFRYHDATVAIEAGTHSPWISRLLKEIGCNVYVGNPRKCVLPASQCKFKKVDITFKVGPVEKTDCKAMSGNFYRRDVSQNPPDLVKMRFRYYLLFPSIFARLCFRRSMATRRQGSGRSQKSGSAVWSGIQRDLYFAGYKYVSGS